MSIRDEIKARVGEGRLFHLPHSLAGVPAGRTVFVSDEVARVAIGPWPNDTAGLRFSQLRAHLDVFTSGGMISVAPDPFTKPKSTYLAAIDPVSDGVWDIRSIDPSPAIRVLGSFAETDVFVALVWDYRSNLGGPGSKEWRDFREHSKSEWKKLFPTYPPLIAENINGYVSRNFIVV
jgi:hypothetical protein